MKGFLNTVTQAKREEIEYLKSKLPLTAVRHDTALTNKKPMSAMVTMAMAYSGGRPGLLK